jgi:HEAT repeat protein
MKRRWPGWATAAVAFGPPIVAFAIVFWPWHPRWEEALRDPNPAVRAAALRKMSRDGNEQLLIDALKDENADVRFLAAEKLRGQGPKGAERASALCRALEDDRYWVRREAAWSLSWIGPEAWPALREALNDENPLVKAGAALALRDACHHKESRDCPWPARESEAVAPELRRLRSDADPEVSRRAQKALDEILWYRDRCD